MKEIEEFCPIDNNDWRNWLIVNSNKSSGIWLIYYKVNTPKYNLSWSEAVDEALCFGWIDSRKKKIDNERYMQFFSKRKSNSLWSKVNKEKIKLLDINGKITNEGYRVIDISKQNGMWDLSDKIENCVLPSLLQLEFIKNNDIKSAFMSLTNSKQKQILLWLYSAKRNDTLRSRVIKLVESLCKNELPNQFR